MEVSPDLAVFAHAAPRLLDLRIIEANSQREVPYKLLVERGEQQRSSIAVTLPRIDVGEPTVKMTFGVNTSPFAGRGESYALLASCVKDYIKRLK